MNVDITHVVIVNSCLLSQGFIQDLRGGRV